MKNINTIVKNLKWFVTKFVIGMGYQLSIQLKANDPLNTLLVGRLMIKMNTFYNNNRMICSPEYNVKINDNDIPVWYNVITDKEFLRLLKFVPNMENCLYIAPIVNEIVNQITGELLGYIIIIPESFNEDAELREFCIQRELGHISLGHLSSEFMNKRLSEKDLFNLEWAADKYALEQTGLDTEILERLQKMMVKSTIGAIPFLKKLYSEKHIDLSTIDSMYKKRLTKATVA